MKFSTSIPLISAALASIASVAPVMDKSSSHIMAVAALSSNVVKRCAECTHQNSAALNLVVKPFADRYANNANVHLHNLMRELATASITVETEKTLIVLDTRLTKLVVGCIQAITNAEQLSKNYTEMITSTGIAPTLEPAPAEMPMLTPEVPTIVLETPTAASEVIHEAPTPVPEAIPEAPVYAPVPEVVDISNPTLTYKDAKDTKDVLNLWLILEEEFLFLSNLNLDLGLNSTINAKVNVKVKVASKNVGDSNIGVRSRLTVTATFRAAPRSKINAKINIDIKEGNHAGMLANLIAKFN
ncbi:hypothetical protein EDD11_002443 [Mortierella claussenii]|nr:hypothetical protein EDD11_002443 [Mortierella claussenii]